jgi:predicted aminopeptidase
LRGLAAAGFAVLLVCLMGCRTYYGQAIQGQWQMLTAPQPVGALLASTNTSPDLKAKLELVLRLRTFAQRELRLKPDGHYANYADLGRPFAVWTVDAAPEFSFEEKTWWYPVVGSLSYRGYFRKDLARSCADRLAREGWDVHLGGVEAYSTLGWFPDPLLNTFIHRDEPELAKLLFHELAHQRVFVAGDTEFNEAFATTVADSGVRRWLRANGNTNALAAYEAAGRREAEFIALLQQTRAELKTLYAKTNALTVAAMREQKAAAFARLRERHAAWKQSYGGDSSHDGWFNRPLNNASLNTVETYHHFVPGFTALLEHHGGDLEKFYREVRKLGRVGKDERHRRLIQLAGQAKPN